MELSDIPFSSDTPVNHKYFVRNTLGLLSLAAQERCTVRKSVKVVTRGGGLRIFCQLILGVSFSPTNWTLFGKTEAVIYNSTL